MRIFSCLLLCVLAACDPGSVKLDDGSDTGADGPVDADGDGYVSSDQGGPDCDDTDATVNPGTEETWYDGIDSDCDGASDNDADADGHDDIGHGGDDCDDADASIYPGADETWYDGIDDNCDGRGDNDADGDGHAAVGHGGDDCLDEDAEAYPGAYDTPNDAIDQDCDGADRAFDGAVVPYDETVEYDGAFDVTGLGGLDIAVLMDTTCSMGSALSYFSFSELASGLGDLSDQIAWGYATFDDYPYNSYGSAGYDTPFHLLKQQMTDRLDAASNAHASTSLHSGGDYPESSIEALYQALSGAGYDMDCDAAYDSTQDVLPFIADSADPFRGLGGQSYDSTVSGSGTRGGMGFRASALPVIVYVTDANLRDPDAGYGTPGGCSFDAGASDVVSAAGELGAFLVGISYNGTVPVEQMQSLATATGSLVDSDGDGAVDDPAVYAASASNITDAVRGAIEDLTATVNLSASYGECVIEVSDDPLNLVRSVAPARYTDVDTATTASLPFTLTLEGTTFSSVALVSSVTLDLVCDGGTVASQSIAVEIPPG